MYNNLEKIDEGWIGLKTIIKVERYVKSSKKISREIAYYISSLGDNMTAKKFNEGIRSHWSIENGLHYVKDKTFKEDDCKILSGNGAKNMSAIRNIIINVFRNNGFENMAQAIRIVGNDINKMWQLF